MKTYKEIISEVAEPLGGDEKRFKAKHVIQKINHPAAEDDQFTGGKTTKKDKSKIASYKDGEDEIVYEELDKEDDMCPECEESYDECECEDDEDDEEEMDEAAMSPADMKQRENIVKGMKKSKADLQARYGDRWKSVMYATATKKAMEAVEFDEAVNVKGIQKAVDDGKSMDVIMTMFANKRTTNTDEIRQVVKDYMFKKRMKKEEVVLDEAGPKMKPDFLKTQRAKDAAHNAAMGRTATGRKKPVRAMTSTQRSMASMRKEEVELDEAKMTGNYARVMYDYREDYYNITVYKNGKEVASDDGYFGANETGNPLIKKFTDVVKKAGLKPEGLPIVDEDGKKGVFKGNTFKWNTKEAVELDEISRDLATRAAHGFADKGDRALKNKDSREYKRSERGRKMAVDKATGYAKVNAVPRRVKLPEEVELDEAFKAGEMKLSDGSSVKLTNEDVSALNTLFKELNSANQKKMQERMMKDKKGFAEIVSFAKEAL